MFKKFLVSIFLAFLFITSSTLVAEHSHVSVALAAVQLDDQSVVRDVQQFAQKGEVMKMVGETDQELTLPVTTSLWIMVFGLLLFVLRGGAQRI